MSNILTEESKKLDELTKTVQEIIYQVRWVEAFGKSGQLATDEELAKAAVSVFVQSELYGGLSK